MQSESHNPPPHSIPSRIPKLNKEPIHKRLFRKSKFPKKISFTPLTQPGTGKTYASAFAMRELGFKRVLFLVHRNQIARQSKASFERVFGSRIRTGIVLGNMHEYDADFIFATVQI